MDRLTETLIEYNTLFDEKNKVKETLGNLFQDGIDYDTDLAILNKTGYKVFEEIYKEEGLTTDMPFL